MAWKSVALSKWPSFAYAQAVLARSCVLNSSRQRADARLSASNSPFSRWHALAKAHAVLADPAR